MESKHVGAILESKADLYRRAKARPEIIHHLLVSRNEYIIVYDDIQ